MLPISKGNGRYRDGNQYVHLGAKVKRFEGGFNSMENVAYFDV